MFELTFGERLTDLRKIKSVTQDDLAVLLDVDRSTISGYENGKSFPSVEKTIKLAHYFAVSIDYLLAQKDHSSHDDVLDRTFTVYENQAISIGFLIENSMSLADAAKQDLLYIVEILKNDCSGNIKKIIAFYQSLIERGDISIKTK